MDKNCNLEENKLTEKLALLAEQGLQAVKLTQDEQEYLINQGIETVYDIWELLKTKTPDISPEMQEKILHTMSTSQNPKDVSSAIRKHITDAWIKLTDQNISLIHSVQGWISPSPLFATRKINDHTKAKTLSFYRLYPTAQVHVELRYTPDCFVDIMIQLIQEQNYLDDLLEIQLIRDGSCCEVVSGKANEIFSFFSLEVHDYSLEICLSPDTIIGIDLYLDRTTPA